MIFDTDVLAEALVGESPRTEEALAALLAAPDVEVPDLAIAELANVLWKMKLLGRVSSDQAATALAAVRRWVRTVFSSVELAREALRLAVERRHPAYDAFFAAAARNRGSKVVTYDRRFIRSFPDAAITPAQFLDSLTR